MKGLAELLKSASCSNKLRILAEVCPDCSHPAEYEKSQPVCRNKDCNTYIIPYEK